jgi:hypothetical protein
VVVCQKCSSQLQYGVPVGFKRLITFLWGGRSQTLGCPLNKSRVQGDSCLSDQLMCVQIALKISKYRRQLRSPIPLRLCQVVSVDVVGVKNGSALGGGYIVLSPELLLVIHFGPGISF